MQVVVILSGAQRSRRIYARTNLQAVPAPLAQDTGFVIRLPRSFDFALRASLRMTTVCNVWHGSP